MPAADQLQGRAEGAPRKGPIQKGNRPGHPDPAAPASRCGEKRGARALAHRASLATASRAARSGRARSRARGRPQSDRSLVLLRGRIGQARPTPSWFTGTQVAGRPGAAAASTGAPRLRSREGGPARWLGEPGTRRSRAPACALRTGCRRDPAPRERAAQALAITRSAKPRSASSFCWRVIVSFS
jgi:hypothetical protein